MCCITDTEVNGHACSVNGQSGTCLDSGTCTRKAGVLHTGVAACSGLANNVQCCVSGTPAPTPTPRAACHYHSAGGHCSDLNECISSRGDLHSSASGASGCEPYPANVECCTGAPGCRYKGHGGVCMDISYCAGTGKASSDGATGCEAYPNNIVCCFTGVSNLEDEVAPEPGPATYAYSSSSAVSGSGNSQTAIIAGSVVSALVVAAIIAVVVFCMLVLRRRRNNHGERLDESTTASAISMNQDNTEATGAPPRFI